MRLAGSVVALAKWGRWRTAPGDLGGRARRQLLLRTRTVLYSAGAYIARAGEPADRLMVVVSGCVNICLPGHRECLSQIGAG